MLCYALSPGGKICHLRWWRVVVVVRIFVT